MRVRLSRALVFDLKSPRVLADGFRAYVGGESGAGKSNCVGLVVEQVVEQGGQVVILDPHAEYRALWQASPSTITCVGYGDPPVEQESVAECLEVIKRGGSLLIDLSHWVLKPREMDAFVLEFIRGLFDLRVKDPKFTLLVIEEAASFAPQLQMTGQSENVLIFTKIVTEGRKFGLQCLLTSQQQSLVDVRVLKGCNVRLFLRTSDFGDWKRVKPYIPPSMNVTFNRDEFSGIKFFESGEAIALSRWTPEARVRLLQPKIQLRKADL